ncbi:MAG: NnrS family protein [Xanthomonadales bacterium]|nr:NnrS family protein [Gammaproteobacteria bacterium]MBT8055073.1 NnrS family protein [Gammaproteobacteria bacterium]NND57323.1 NnrS family protein [Xanthomonadales bacterium]NNK51776.1 NnrS family protein [Xanthomonadales bacterium]
MTLESLWSKGFRPFFIGASVFAVVSMAAWLSIYRFGLQLELSGVSIFQWHAHEMLYGYAIAVIAGFLLTATGNWTGLETAKGAWLSLIFIFWLAARILLINGTAHLVYAAVADLAFMAGLGLAVARPIIKVRQKRQTLILLLVALLTGSNLLFYLGAAGIVDNGVRLGIQGGLYLVLGMVLFMGRRVIPFFTANGVGYEVEMKNPRWNDVATLVLYPAFLLSEVFFSGSLAGALFAAGLFVSNSIRVNGWHTLGIWQKPLIWGLFAAFLMINLGFLLRALAPVTVIPDFLHVHAFAVGGIGIITMSMMARVSLGHTGRNVHESPAVMLFLLVAMVAGALFRLIFPMFDPANYQAWIVISGSIWIISFTVFSLYFMPMLWKPRVDTQKS